MHLTALRLTTVAASQSTQELGPNAWVSATGYLVCLQAC